MNIFVTGISKGLGLQITRTLVSNGYCVYGISRTMTNPLQELIEKFPELLKWYGFDLSEPDRIKKTIFSEFIPLDTPIHGLVNNAAVAYDDLITNLKIAPLEKMYKVNVIAPMFLTKNIIRNMIYNRIPGSLVHVSSISVHTGYKGLSMYASTKGALEAFSKNCAREWGSKNIRSNCLVAGFMETEMSSALDDSQKTRIYKRTALKKATTTISVASTIEFLLSDKSASITGQNIHVDSGTI